MLGAVSSVARFAGPKLLALFKNPATGQMLTKSELAARFAPDLFFGGVEAVMTPGDLGDKAIAGLASATGGSLGGLALGRFGGKNQALGYALDMAGSLGGDLIGRSIGEGIQRGKDKLSGGLGQTPYERLNERDRKAFEEAIRQDQTGQLLAELGLLPASTQSALYSGAYSDPTTGMGVA